jgi:hypothetical protein
MYPEVRVYSDPFEGLKVQLTELRGLIKIVPPLIEADREQRWREIGERPSDGEDDEVIDVYQAEAGPEEGWGFADFGRTIRVAAVVFAWAVFRDYLAHELRDYLAHELKRSYPTYNFGSRALTVLLDEDVRKWDRRFDHIKKRYEDFAGIALKDLPSWHQVQSARAGATQRSGAQPGAGTPRGTWTRTSPIGRRTRSFRSGCLGMLG